MKAYITERGVEVFAENWAEAHALRGMSAVGSNLDEFVRNITIHTDPATLKERENDLHDAV